MNINFHPRRGTILYCDFVGLKPPEIVKVRPVVVLSGKHKELCTVVPLSGTPPDPVEAHHHLLEQASLPQSLAGENIWAKCDVIMTVAFWRLDRAKGGRDANGKRIYEAKRISAADLRAIERCVLSALSMNHLLLPPQ
jgi:uncharacterized protein YifN (PemK superfamily)